MSVWQADWIGQSKQIKMFLGGAVKQDYFHMRIESDVLCQDYGLSIVKEPKYCRSKKYKEWKADIEEKPTCRSMVKADIDQAILEFMTERRIGDNLYKKGYYIKFGKDVALRPGGKGRGLKLCRNS